MNGCGARLRISGWAWSCEPYSWAERGLCTEDGKPTATEKNASMSKKLPDTAVVTLHFMGDESTWNITARRLAKSGWVEVSSDAHAPVRLAIERLIRHRYGYRGQRISAETVGPAGWWACWVYGAEYWMDGTFTVIDAEPCVESAEAMCV